MVQETKLAEATRMQRNYRILYEVTSSADPKHAFFRERFNFWTQKLTEMRAYMPQSTGTYDV